VPHMIEVIRSWIPTYEKTFFIKLMRIVGSEKRLAVSWHSPAPGKKSVFICYMLFGGKY